MGNVVAAASASSAVTLRQMCNYPMALTFLVAYLSSTTASRP